MSYTLIACQCHYHNSLQSKIFVRQSFLCTLGLSQWAKNTLLQTAFSATLPTGLLSSQIALYFGGLRLPTLHTLGFCRDLQSVSMFSLDGIQETVSVQTNSAIFVLLLLLGLHKGGEGGRGTSSAANNFSLFMLFCFFLFFCCPLVEVPSSLF